MSRIADISTAELSAEQKRTYDEIAGSRRGGVRGPYRIWLRNPALADRTQRLGELLRFETSLAPRIRELAILITARFWSAQFEWHAHEPHAAEAGLGEDIITAIRERRRPDFTDDSDQVVYDVCTELYETHRLSDATYAAAVACLGELTVIELVALGGYYSMIALTLNAFEAPLPEGAPPPFKDDPPPFKDDPPPFKDDPPPFKDE